MFVAVRFGRYVVLLAVGLERSGRFWRLLLRGRDLDSTHPPAPLWDGSLTGFPLGLCRGVGAFPRELSPGGTLQGIADMRVFGSRCSG